MIKTLSKAQKMEREKFRIPRSVQDAIPIRRIFRDFFKAGEQAAAEFNIHEHAKRAQHFKDWLCPDSMEFAADHFKIDARFGRVLYLQDYASYIKDSFVSELCDLDRDLMLSMEHIRDLQSTRLYLRDGTELPVSSHTASAVRKIYTQWRSAKKWVIG